MRGRSRHVLRGGFGRRRHSDVCPGLNYQTADEDERKPDPHGDRRSVSKNGGCNYHVSHPGGLAFDRFPTNELEAESRRMARFFPFGLAGSRFGQNPAISNTLSPWLRDLTPDVLSTSGNFSHHR
jgi:hypothetical protein